jgi:hypothetical protein
MPRRSGPAADQGIFEGDCEEMGGAGKHVETGAVKPPDKVTERDSVTRGDEWQ